MICRYCDSNLSNGDIFKTLKDMYRKSDTETLKMAKSYGWTPINKIHFTRELIIQFEYRNKPQIQICPDCNGISPTDETAPREYLQT
jgi:hypothetical protein